MNMITKLNIQKEHMLISKENNYVDIIMQT